MTLGEKQQLFTVMIGNLIHWAEEKGYRLTFGEAYRTPEQAALKITGRWVSSGSPSAAAGAGALNPTLTAITLAWNITGCADEPCGRGRCSALCAGICRRLEGGNLAT